MNERRFELPCGSMAALEIGNEKTTACSVVFLHGWMDNAGSFKALMNAIHQRAPELHLLAIDLFGHGLSSHKSSDNYYPFHDYIADLHQLLDELSPNRLVLVGHSLGALIASCYSAAFPEQVEALVQIEGAGPLAENPSNSVKRLRNGVLSRQRQRNKPERAIASFDLALKLRMQANHLTAEQLMPIVERGTECRDNQWFWRHDAKLKCESLYRMAQDHANAITSQICCPHLIILGDKGFQHLQSNQVDWGENPPNVVSVAGGHHCHLEQKLEVAKRILGVVNKI
ncbi:alpha/beta fold hydrolase [Vibrio rotiferianus]|uniref:Alpha/beta hydrolase n=1 Tax=Vibrio rotiferianus TaxID=190895 RepID=A0A7Y3Z9D1_9VIBR|nr:alpha/beta hydrolase [Vibrio rotiferianus]NOH48697.1 alpha/beta hydrolase [Vibrio rotiferianus]NOH67940.1 alpha/beta hydrolase [Vibrio rotiferianus]TMX58126.1 alpha/beta hydrolase [Vibrio rotiferianus]